MICWVNWKTVRNRYLESIVSWGPLYEYYRYIIILSTNRTQYMFCK